jgi:hypothetical protein
VSILDLPLNVLKSNLLYIKKELYYKLDIPDSLDGETVLVSLNSNKQITPNELYIKFGNVPTRASFDFEYEKANSGNQEILIPNALIGTYYILAYNDSAIGTQNISLLAEKINFSIRSVLTAEGGNTGLVTTKIRGAKFEPNMQIRLQHNVLGTITANNVQYINNTTLFVTFNLSGKTASIYNVKATKNNKDSTILQNGFIILKGSGGGFQTGGTTAGGFYCSIKNIGVDPLLGVDVQSPGGVRPFQFFKMDINFGNSGNVDISLPHRLLVSVSGLPIALSQAELASAAKKEIYLEFKEVNGPIGILRPGVTGSITIYSQGAGFGRFSFRLIE